MGVVSALLVSVLVLFAPAPAQAASTYLCTGYTSCASQGYSNAGYSAVNDRMYWRMYSGHNCTNYVAYRLIKAGLPTERPWSGSGMAYNWGVANASITDQTPTVGAVAWWKRNSGGVGSSGHVAYVERVISATEIVISEDSWGGDFSWRRILKGSGSWPSGGFIHFRDQVTNALTSTAPPTITGTPQVGVQLRTTVGGWRGGPTAYDFQWLVDGVAKPGATFTGYTPTGDDLGKTVTVQVTANRTGYQSGTATSAPTAAIAKGVYAVVAPTEVSGTPLVDEVLTVTPGTFSPSPARSSLQWRADGAVIPGATGRTLRLDAALVGKAVTALTIARGDGFVKVGSRSDPAGPVLAGAIEITQPYAVTGRPRIGETLTIRPGVFTPADAAYSYTWLRDGAVAAGPADAATYVLTAADVGHQISAQVRLTKDNYLERVEVVPVGLVRTVPLVAATAKGRLGKAVIKVRVTAPGVERLPGTVVVKVAGQKTTSRVKNGLARVVVSGLAAGKHQVVVRFLGTQVVEQGSATTSAWVKR